MAVLSKYKILGLITRGIKQQVRGNRVKRGYRNRDCIESIEGLLFTVVGDVHPVERVLAYLKYAPDSEGAWGFGTRRYDRALKYYSTLHVKDTLDYLAEFYPQYLYNSETQHLIMSAVPLQSIRTHHCPETRLSNLLGVEHLDRLESKALRLARIISEESHVDLKQFGVAGSILVDIHNPRFSDIDLTVYGRENSLKVKTAVLNMLDSGDQNLCRFDEADIKKWVASRAWLYPLGWPEVELIYRRHWSRGIFEGTEFSIHPGRVETEIGETCGDRIYSPEGMVEAEAVVDDASDAMFMPGTYRITSVEIIDGPAVADIREIATYEGFYCDIASPGEMVLARGKLEKVDDKRNGDVYHRILIGSIEAKGKDYLKPEAG